MAHMRISINLKMLQDTEQSKLLQDKEYIRFSD